MKCVYHAPANAYNKADQRQVEFVLSIMKITACLGFIILGIIINVGGVPSDNRGYIGNRY